MTTGAGGKEYQVCSLTFKASGRNNTHHVPALVTLAKSVTWPQLPSEEDVGKSTLPVALMEESVIVG